ncbi:hypothetical protein [Flavobacterium sp. '19STA2R22 D10 B1']|uniref:hypothetical protein n=1 Tax=Flavobacterium aerium TaxID=3037261 RepID=UPI00278C25F4|nr:hypothetical protein [Flavobacterium sp. '19STA2R22 D10 B1']
MALVFFCSFSNAQDLQAISKKLGVDKLTKIEQTTFYISKKQDLSGLVDENFQPVFPPIFTYYEFYSGTNFIKLKSIDEKYTLYDLINKKKLQEGKQWISPFHPLKLHDRIVNFYYLRNDESEDNLLYNENNDLIKNLKRYSISVLGGENYGVLILENSGRNNLIVIDEKGKEIFSYPYIYQPYKEKDLFIVKSEKSNKYGILNHLGEKIKEIEFDNIFLKQDIIVMKKNNVYIVSDLNFNPKFKIPDVQEIDFISDDLILIKISDDNWKLITKDGKTNFQITAKKIEYFKNDKLKVINDLETYYVDLQGNRIQ